MTSPKGTIFLTGANGGLGRAIASEILRTPEYASHHAIYAVRDASSATGLRQVLDGASSYSHSHDILSLALSRLNDVRSVAASVNARVTAGEIPRIKILILNAGFVEPTAQSFTEDGFDMTFASNYLGHWLLALLLLQSMEPDVGRIIVLSSTVHDPNDPHTHAAGHVKDAKWKTVFENPDSTEAIARGTWSKTQEEPIWRSWHAGQRRYGASKLCAVMMVGELQRRLDTDPSLAGISVLGFDPGTMPTELVRRTPWVVRVLLWKCILPLVCTVATWLDPNGFLRTTAKSASDAMVLAFEVGPPLCERPKGWYMYGLQQKDPSIESKDLRKRRTLWTDSVRYASLSEGETQLVDWK